MQYAKDQSKLWYKNLEDLIEIIRTRIAKNAVINFFMIGYLNCLILFDEPTLRFNIYLTYTNANEKY
ncbi:MAG: hypothetical protein KBF99_13460 [Leptospiraceae bacterium]|nr:hypothetical protein [Leptospiraceae bacterium]